ncbi:MAG TPA: methylmalonyl-CoA mutase family protein [Thermoanaerobaculia bacterium]|nr:methylmalonyl-CoA mutase family protein [Thermoanaerobaculia bacterium]
MASDEPPPDPLWPPFPETSYDDWRQRVAGELGEEGLAILTTSTLEGIAIAPLYAAGQVEEPLPVPAPAVVGRPWEPWMTYGDADPARIGEAIRRDLALGLEGVWLRCDEASRSGLDSDWEEASARVGLGGLALATSDDLAEALASAPLERLGVGLEAGAQALPAAALLLAAAERLGHPPAALRGCLGADPLAALATGEALPLADLCQELGSLGAWCRQHAPGLCAARVGTGPYVDAGADSVQEVAYALATGNEYLAALGTAGLGPADAAAQILFVLEGGRDLYLQIAKLRAARTLWAAVLRAWGVAGEPPAMRLHVRGAWRTVTAYDRWGNLLRGTVEALAAVAGGAEAVTLPPYDQASGGDGERAHRLALTTQLVLRDEGQLHRVADPAAGSWYVEALTRELAGRAWEGFQRLESSGGMGRALTVGVVAGQVEEASQRRREALANRQLPVVGVSSFADPAEELPAARAEPSTELLAARRERLRQGRRHQQGAALEKLRQGATRAHHPGPELAAAAIAAARGGDTLGQLAQALERRRPDARGPHLPRWRDAEPFETLRRRVQRRPPEERPSLPLLRLGDPGDTAAGAAFARRLLAAAGLRVRELPSGAAEVAASPGASPPPAVVLVAPDGEVEALARAAAAARRAGSRWVLAVVARPPAGGGDEEAAVDHWLYEGCDALGILADLLRHLEVAG